MKVICNHCKHLVDPTICVSDNRLIVRCMKCASWYEVDYYAKLSQIISIFENLIYPGKRK